MTTTETSLAFVETISNMLADGLPVSKTALEKYAKFAKTAALIEEHKLSISPPMGLDEDWCAYDVKDDDTQTFEPTLHEAVRAVADKIKEEK